MDKSELFGRANACLMILSHLHISAAHLQLSMAEMPHGFTEKEAEAASEELVKIGQRMDHLAQHFSRLYHDARQRVQQP